MDAITQTAAMAHELAVAVFPIQYSQGVSPSKMSKAETENQTK
jgi:hypothetical protein